MSYFIKREFVPDELKDVYVDFYWSQKKLWEIKLPVLEIEISKLDWILDYPVWYMDSHPIPAIVLKGKREESPHHWSRIDEADLSFPIHVIEWKSRLLILDGIHRIIKSKIAGKMTIKAKILGENNIVEILPSDEDFETGFLRQFKKI